MQAQRVLEKNRELARSLGMLQQFEIGRKVWVYAPPSTHSAVTGVDDAGDLERSSSHASFCTNGEVQLSS